MKKAKCIIPECKKESTTRGLCHSHYTYASILVKKGQYSWENLEKEGKVLPAIRATKCNIRMWFDGGAK